MTQPQFELMTRIVLEGSISRYHPNTPDKRLACRMDKVVLIRMGPMPHKKYTATVGGINAYYGAETRGMQSKR